MSVPVLFIIFNRPEKTRRVFEQIRKARPPALYIAADGPRPDRPGETNLCEETRQTVLNGIDWSCEVNTLFRAKNLGCKLAVSSAITWFFEQVEEGIIMEDDCLPDLSFFRFCEELLEKYRDNAKIMMISGNNFQPVSRCAENYFFSRYVHIWGWASWRRAWQHYDLSMQKWPAFHDSRQLCSFLPKSVARRRTRQFNDAFRGKTSTWDAQWVFACWEAGGLSILPNINLVTNIDSGGTHMKIYDPFIHRPSKPMGFPLIHPGIIRINEAADIYTQRYVVLRNWKKTLLLIIKYLLRILRTRPRQLPGDTITIWKSLIAEARHRLSRRLTPNPSLRSKPARNVPPHP